MIYELNHTQICEVVLYRTEILPRQDKTRWRNKCSRSVPSVISVLVDTIFLNIWYTKLLISVDSWTIEQRVLISSGLLIKGSLVMLVSVDSRDAENALPKDWSANDIADVEVITGSASGVLGILWSLARRFWSSTFVCDPENLILF